VKDCCADAANALRLANQALAAANKAEADAQNAANKSSNQDHSDDEKLSKLPACKDGEANDAPTTCTFRVSVAFRRIDLIHHHAGDVPFSESADGATGFHSLSTDAGNQVFCFNNFADAKQFVISKNDAQFARDEDPGGWVVGQVQDFGASALNFHISDDSDPSGCANPKERQITGYTDARTLKSR
jgi:hypothetical protein